MNLNHLISRGCLWGIGILIYIESTLKMDSAGQIVRAFLMYLLVGILLDRVFVAFIGDVEGGK